MATVTSLQKPKCILGTHFHPETKTLFGIDKCEKCNGEVQAPNAVGLNNPQDFDLIHVKELPPEQWHSDKLGHCCCDICGED
jgi:hypothetical protein